MSFMIKEKDQSLNDVWQKYPKTPTYDQRLSEIERKLDILIARTSKAVKKPTKSYYKKKAPKISKYDAIWAQIETLAKGDVAVFDFGQAPSSYMTHKKYGAGVFKIIQTGTKVIFTKKKDVK